MHEPIVMWWAVLKIAFGGLAAWWAWHVRRVDLWTTLLYASIAGFVITSAVREFAPSTALQLLQFAFTLGFVVAFAGPFWAARSDELTRLPFMPNTPVPARYRKRCIAASSVTLAGFISILAVAFALTSAPSFVVPIVVAASVAVGVAGVSMLAHTIHLVKRYHARRFAGRCGACGYDLRGSRGTCPECGEPVA